MIKAVHFAHTNRTIDLASIIHLCGFLDDLPVLGIFFFGFLALLSYWLFLFIGLCSGEMWSVEETEAVPFDYSGASWECTVAGFCVNHDA